MELKDSKGFWIKKFCLKLFRCWGRLFLAFELSMWARLFLSFRMPLRILTKVSKLFLCLSLNKEAFLWWKISCFAVSFVINWFRALWIVYSSIWFFWRFV